MRKRTIGILLGMAVLVFVSGRVSTAIDSVYAAEESDTSDDEEDEDEEEEDDSYTKELEQCIQVFHKNGIQLCMDDFGSGYANLNNILRLPFSAIKMDRSLLQEICENENKAVFYHSMIDMFHDMGYQIISEGVETEQEAKLLAEWKVDMIQGYYYAKPLSEKDVLAVWK